MILPLVISITILLCPISSLIVRAFDTDEINDINSDKITYGAIVDCGSSGTRAHIFVWNASLGYPNLLNYIEPLRDKSGTPITKKIYPGLSSLKDSPKRASEYMRPIIEFITDNIPKESHVNTGIYILGTAGMRMLDEETQLSIMNEIAEDLKVKYDFAKVKTSVISGASEGIYQWLTLNSKAKRFGITKNGSKVQTYALIEMGGASIQVTYQLLDSYDRIYSSLAETSGAQEAFDAQITTPRIGIQVKQYNYTVVSTTFLGLGSNSARQAYVDYLVRNAGYLKRYNRDFGIFMQGKNIVLTDPCLPIGSQQIVKRPIKMLISKDQTVGFDIEDDDTTFKVGLIGGGQFSVCRLYLKHMLSIAKKEKLNCKLNEPCTMSLIGTSFVPFDDLEFSGLGDFYYTTKEMMNLDGKLDQEKFVMKTKEICQTSYADLLDQYPEANKNDPSRVILECFKAVWIDTFLSFGINMPRDYDKLITIGQINGDNIDWTLGAVIDKAFAIQRSSRSGRFSKLIRTASGIKLIV